MVNDLLHKEIIERMKEYQSQLDYDTMGTEVLLLALMSIEDSMTNLILKELHVTTNDVLNLIKDFYFLREAYNYTFTLINIFDKTKDLQKTKDFVYDEAYLYSILESETDELKHEVTEFVATTDTAKIYLMKLTNKNLWVNYMKTILFVLPAVFFIYLLVCTVLFTISEVKEYKERLQ